MTNLNLALTVVAAAELLIIGICIFLIRLYLYQSRDLKSKLQRKSQALRDEIRTNDRLSERSPIILEQELQPKLLRSSATYNRREPQYKHQTDDFLSMMSKQGLLKEISPLVKTEMITTSPGVVKFEHSILVIEQDDESDF